jgi:alpha-tubulin suppressor-like RCC1 family protein
MNSGKKMKPIFWCVVVMLLPCALTQAEAIAETTPNDGFFYGWIGSHGPDKKYLQVDVCFSSGGGSVFFDKATMKRTSLTKQRNEWVELENGVVTGRWKLSAKPFGAFEGNWLNAKGQPQGQIQLARIYFAVQPAVGCEAAEGTRPGQASGAVGKSAHAEKPLRAISVSAGGSHSCAALSDGTVRCWGSSQWPVNESNGISVADINVAGVTAVAQDCALLRDGGVICWGGNSKKPQLIEGVNGAVSLTSRCAVLRSGKIMCWGSNKFGELGNGNTISGTKAVDVYGIENAISVSVNALHACAALSDGSVKCWGNESGRQGKFGGPNEEATRTKPVNVPGVKNAVSVSAGMLHNCAQLRDGKVQCWGENDYGQLGVLDAPSVILTPGGSEGVLNIVNVEGVSDATSLAAGSDFTCALLRTGDVKCWGINFDGQLGDPSAASPSTPVTVRDVSGAVALSAGYQHACAVIKGGQVKCWGRNYAGQLGSLAGWLSNTGAHAATGVVGFE